MTELILGDSLDVLIDHRGKTPKKLGADFTGRGVPVASAVLVSDGRLRLDDARHVSPATYERWMPERTRKHDVILTSEAPLGRVALVESNEPLVLGQRLFGLRGKRGVLDSRFLYYALQTDAVQSDLLGRSTGTTVFGIRQSALRNVKIPAPPFGEQRAIAEVLGALDDKIAANTRLESTLRQYVSSSFGWIVGHTPTRTHLRRLIATTKGVSYRSADLAPSTTALVTLKSFVRSGGYTTAGLKPYIGPYKPAQRLAPGELAVAQTDLTQAADVIGRAVRIPESRQYDALVASLDLVIVRPIPPVPAGFIFGVLLEHDFREHCKMRTSGTTVLHLASDAIGSYEAPDVPAETQLRYASAVAPALEMGDSLTEESRRLAAARDALLPHLMSGRLRVKDAEAVAESVL